MPIDKWAKVKADYNAKKDYGKQFGKMQNESIGKALDNIKPEYYRLKYGKYAGHKLTEIPIDYLKWVLTCEWVNKCPILRYAITEEIRTRK